jgi:hypothetical protein
MKISFSPHKLAAVIAACLILTILSACEETRSFMSTNRLAANESGKTVVSITLNVVGEPLDTPIEVLEKPLLPGDVQAVFFSLPEKQAKNNDWEVTCELDDGTKSNPLDVGNINPHGDDSRLTCFSVAWNDSTSLPMMRAYFDGGEADYGIYDPGDATYGTIEGYEAETTTIEETTVIEEETTDYEETDYEEETTDAYAETDGSLDALDALSYLEDKLVELGGYLGDYNLAEYYGEPQAVFTEDFSGIIYVWVYHDLTDAAPITFYAVDIDDGTPYIYDMGPGAVISFDNFAGGGDSEEYDSGEIVIANEGNAWELVMNDTEFIVDELAESDIIPTYVFIKESDMDGVRAWYFAIGEDSEEQFVAYFHVAVDELGNVWMQGDDGSWTDIN